MDFYKYVLSSEHYDSEGKTKQKRGTKKLMEKLNEMSDNEIDVINGMFLWLNYFLLINFIYWIESYPW